MAATAAELVVEVRGRDVGVEALLKRIQAQLQQAEASAQRTGAGFGGPLASGQRQAAGSATSLLQAQARLSVAQGNLAGAVNIYNQALRTEGVGVREAINLKTQLANVERRLAAETEKAARANQQVQGIFKGNSAAVGGFTSALNGVNSALGAFGLALGAQQLVQFGVELVQVGTQASQTAARFNQAAVAAGTTGEALTAALRQASAGTISDLNLQLAANRARLLGVADSAAELAPLLAIARDRAQEMGISTTQAFNDLVTGLGRGSPLILDNLGITLSVAQANETYAASLGKTASALTEAEQKQALINAVLAQGQAAVAAGGGAIETHATKIERLNAALDNLKVRAGTLLAVRLTPFIEDVGKLADAAAGIGTVGDALSGLADVNARFGPLLSNMELLRATVSNLTGARMPDFATQLQGSIASWETFTGQLQQGAGLLDALSSAGAAHTAVLEGQAVAANTAASGTAVFAQAGLVEADATQAAAAALRDHAAALDAEATRRATQAELDHAAAMEADAAQAQIASVESQTLALTKAELNRQAQFAANALIASGNAGAATAGRLAASSSLVDQLTAAYLRLRAAQAAATGAALANTRVDKANSDAVEVQANKRSVLADQRKREIADYQAAQAAARKYQQEVGNFGPSIEQAQRELDQLPKGSEAAWNKMIEIERLKQQQASAARRGAAKAGGAAHLSDQQKLNNQLLTDQEKANDQAEEAERQHQQRILDIERDFQKKSLEQQRANEVSKRQSRADFYKSLNVDNRGLSQQVRDQLAGAYEAAFAKAQELAASGNAQLADAYLKLKQEQLNAEAQFQKDLAEARKNNDAAQLKALQEARELERQAEAEREKQLLEGGDANVKARQEALDEEERRALEQQEKIGNASDAAAERKINNALRSGKAVEAENLRLQEQEQIINRIGNRGGTGTSTGATAPGPSTPSNTAAPTVPIDLAGLADVMRQAADQITQAIASAGGDIVRAEQATTRTVASLSREKLVQ